MAWAESTLNWLYEEAVFFHPEKKASEERLILAALEKDWPEFSKTFAVKPVLGSTQWRITGVQFMADDTFFVQFEDGHIGNLAILKYDQGKLVLVELFVNKLIYEDYLEYKALLDKYGDGNYEPKSFTTSILRNGEIVWFDGLTLVPVNILLDSIQDSSGWQTYRNEEYGFEVKYPDTYEIKYFTSDIQKDHFIKEGGINIISLTQSENNSSVNDFLRVNYHPNLIEGECMAYTIDDKIRRATLPMSETQLRTINGEIFREASVVGLYGKGDRSTLEARIYHHYRGANCYEVQLAGNFKNLDQILSTFRFIK